MDTNERGAALFTTFLMMMLLAGLATAVGLLSFNSQVGSRSRLQDTQAFHLASAGIQKARQQLVSGGQLVGWGESDVALGAGTYTLTTTDNGNGTYTITSSGYVPNSTSPLAKRQLTEKNITATGSNGTNLSLTATASASSSNGPNVPANATDGNTSTTWRSNVNGNGSWLQMDFGSTTTFDKIIIKEQDYIDGMTFEWSDDGSSWTSLSATVVESPSKTWTATFSEVSHRYVRATFTASSSSKKVEVQEMETYNVSTSLGTGTYSTQW